MSSDSESKGPEKRRASKVSDIPEEKWRFPQGKIQISDMFLYFCLRDPKTTLWIGRLWRRKKGRRFVPNGDGVSLSGYEENLPELVPFDKYDDIVLLD